MATDLCMALELDKDDLCGKIVAIAENNGSNANFIISALISHCIENNIAICLLATHNTFGHYHNVGIKLGGNLQKLKEEGFFKCIEMIKIIESSLKDMPNTSDVDFLFNKNREEIPLKALFIMLKQYTESLLQTQKSVCIMIDNLTDLLLLGYNASQVLNFFQYCREIVSENKGCSLVVLCHTSKEDIESMKIVAGMSHTCNIKVEVNGLNTGLSGDVSGMLRVDKNLTENAYTRSRNMYHFKLEERRILVFPPGTSQAFV